MMEHCASPRSQGAQTADTGDLRASRVFARGVGTPVGPDLAWQVAVEVAREEAEA
jgi:hypothetical protein